MRETIYKDMIHFQAGAPSCRYYDTPTPTASMTLEENLMCKIKSLVAARHYNKMGVKNEQCIKGCEADLQEAIDLCLNSEMIDDVKSWERNMPKSTETPN